MKFDASKLVQLKRPKYFAGKIMGVEDFRAEPGKLRDATQAIVIDVK